MKRTMKRSSAWLLTLLMVLSLTGCGQKITLCPAEAGSDISLVTEEMAAFMAEPDLSRAIRYAHGTKELSHPAPVTLSWTVEEGTPASFVVSVSEKKDMSDAWVYETAETTLDVYNCKIGTTYYWTVAAVTDKGKKQTGAVQEFSTSDDLPRAIFCEGITNMRDCGGWKTGDGKSVNQGLLYRCGRLNVNTNKVVRPEITANGIKTMQQLGVRTEIDLRQVDNNEVGGLTDTSVLPGVQYIQCPMYGTINGLMSKNEAMVRKVFGVLADEKNYPIIFHCSIGTDRTGYVAYLALGLLGVPDEALDRDYLLSNFGAIGSSRSLNRIAGDYIAGIAAYPGASLSEKIEAYLLELGVTQAEIDSFRSIMLG